MPNVDVTEILTVLILRNDIASEWETSSLILAPGEPALEMNPEKKTAKIKIGDGKHTFKELPYSTITPDEIQDMIDASIASSNNGSNSTGVNSVSLKSGNQKGTLKLVVNNVETDDIAVTGLGSAAYTDSSKYATAEQGMKADFAMKYKGTTESLPTNNVSNGDTYKVTNQIDISSAFSHNGEDVSVSIGDMIIADADGRWSVIPSGGVSEVAKSLEKGISATLSGGVTGTATSAANAGETMQIEVTSVNTDYLTPGVKVVILNGGKASN